MRTITTDKAPAAVGHYAQAIESNGFLFCSGQIPIDPVTKELVKGSVAEQTEVILKNIKGLLNSQGLTVDSVIKATVFLKDISTFAEFNDVYASFFGSHKPARSAVEVSNLPKGVDIEIEIIAEKKTRPFS